MRLPICSKPVFKLAAASALVLLTLPGCPNREVAEVDPFKGGVVDKDVVINLNRNIDILFVIDNSSSMGEEQDSLAANFDRFINVLSSVEGGLPSVHIGVVSTDMGAQEPGAIPIPGSLCDENGDAGKLQDTPRVDGCTPPSDPYIVDVEKADGSRTVNYSGSLADTFSCIARLGTNGCVFEQQLEAMRAALTDGTNPGFVRDDAYLGIVFITDEEDCSAHDPHIFNGEEAFNSKGSELGYAISFRCFEWGIQCDPEVTRDPGEYTNCRPRTDSPYLVDPQEYVDFLKTQIGKDESQIILAAITGAPTNGEVSVIDRFRDTNGDGQDESYPDDVEEAPSCQSSTGSAVPPIRIKYVFDQFPPDQTHLAEICNDDLSGPIQAIAEVFAAKIGNTCIPGTLADTDEGAPGIQPNCVVTQIIGDEGGEDDSTIPACDATASNVPCFRIEQSDECDPADYPTQLRIVVERGGEPPPLNAKLSLACEV